MTASSWVSSRVPPPPTRLAQRLRVLLELVDEADRPLADVLLRASADTLGRLLGDASARDAEAPRQNALELLAADALATYAFEAACDEPDTLDARCGEAMRLLSRLPTDA